MSGSLPFRTFAGLVVVAAAVASPPPASGQLKPVKEIRLGRPESDHRKEPNWLGFSPDGRYLAVRYQAAADKDVVRMWDCLEWKERVRWDVAGSGGDGARIGRGAPCAFTPTGTGLFYTAEDGVHLRTLPEGRLPGKDRLVMRVSRGNIQDEYGRNRFKRVAVWPLDDDTDRVVETDSTEMVLLRRSDPGGVDPVQFPLIQPSSRDATSTAVALDRRGKQLAVGWEIERQGVEIELRDVATGKKLRTLPGHRGGASALEFSPDGTLLASGSFDGSVKLWEVATGKEVAVFIGPQFTVSRLVFTPDGKRLIYATFDREGFPNLWLVDVVKKKHLAAVAVDNRDRARVCVRPEGDRIAMCGSDDVVRVWDVDQLIKFGK